MSPTRAGNWFNFLLAALAAAATSPLFAAQTTPIDLPANELREVAALQSFRTASGVSLAGLPTGAQQLANVAWRVPGGVNRPQALALEAGGKAVTLPVGQKLHRLHVLHAMARGPAAEAWERAAVDAKESTGALPPDRPAVARYTLRYEDGVTLAIPVRWGESVGNWERRTFFDRESGFLADLAWAKLGWTAQAPGTGKSAAVYAMDWPNPRPDTAVASVELQSLDGTLAVFALSAATDAAGPTLRFVAPNGDDAGPGSFEKPWATPAKAAQVEPGTTVYFRGGRYRLDAGVVLKQVGGADRWTSFCAFPGEDPVFDASGILPAPEQLVWDPPMTAIRVDGAARGIRVKGLRVENSINNGIHAVSERVEILHNTVYNTWHTGIWGSGKNVKVIGNLLLLTCRTKTLGEFVAANPALDGHKHVQELLAGHAKGKRFRHECLDCGSTGSDGVECAYNEIGHGDKEGIDCKGAPHNVRIHHNYVHHITMPTGIYIDAWTKQMVGVEVDHNVVCNTAVTGIAVASEGGSGLEDIRVHHNVTFDNGCSGLLLSACNADGIKKNVQFEHNTVFRNGTNKTNPNAEGGLHIGSDKAEGIVVRNNIFFANRDYGVARNVAATPAEMGVAISHNLVEPPAKTGQRVFPDATDPKLAAWIHEPGEPVIHGDPLFVDPENFDFRLKPGSPAIGKGMSPDGKPADLGAMPAGL